MHAFEFVNQYIDAMGKEMEIECKEFKYPAMVGILHANLSSILTDISICYPEALDRVLCHGSMGKFYKNQNIEIKL